jgi:hypothetical protein
MTVFGVYAHRTVKSASDRNNTDRRRRGNTFSLARPAALARGGNRLWERRCAGAFLPFSYEVMLVTYATVQFFDASRNLGMLVTTDCLRAWTFGSDSIVGDPAQIRPGETVVFDEVRDGNAIIAVNIRRI